MTTLTWNVRHYLRKCGAILGPLTFSVAGGHFRSAVLSRPVDAYGQPIPWYTYPAVDYLRVLDLSECRVAEFGSGNSTLWWAKHCREVLAIESSPEWYEEIRREIEHMPNVAIRLVSSPEEASKYLRPDYFDIVVVDDGSGVGPKGRPMNAETAFQAVKGTGLVIIDNSDTNYSTPGHYPIIEMANEHGWQRIDFVGHAPGATKRSCTSLFFRAEVQLLSHLKPPSFGQWRKAG